MVKRISRYISVLEQPQFQFPYCNCIYIEDDRRGLIDASPAENNIDLVKKQQLDTLLLSHGHLDHYFFVPDLQVKEVFIHPLDHAIVHSAESYLEVFGFSRFVQDRNLHKSYLDAIHYRTIRTNGDLTDGQLIDFGHVKVQVLHLPGHSAGHCGFLFPEEGFVFTADIDLSPFGPWYGNMNCSLADLLNSIDRLIELQPDYLVTGHGQALITNRVTARLKEYRDIIWARENRIIGCLRRGCHTLLEIARQLPVYQKLPPPEQIFFLYEYVMDWVHLNHLTASGQVFTDSSGYYLSGC